MSNFYTKNGVTLEGLEELKKPFPESVLGWRVSGKVDTTKMKAPVVPYVQAHAVQDRLDSVCGSHNWENGTHHFTVDVFDEKSKLMVKELYCEYSIRIRVDTGAEAGEWIKKTDVGSPSNMDSVKGSYSDGLKRASVMFGIGRYLRQLPFFYESIDTVYGDDKIRIQSREGVYYMKRPKLPTWASDPTTKPTTDKIELAGFTATSWEDMLRQMKADKKISEGLTATKAKIMDGVKAWEDAGKPAQVICEQLVKYFT